jgi:hypothetical protein
VCFPGLWFHEMGQALAWGTRPWVTISPCGLPAVDVNLSLNCHQAAGKNGAQFHVVTRRSADHRRKSGG